MSEQPFEQFPGFKVSPIDESREVKRQSTIGPEPQDYDPEDYYWNDDDENRCPRCDGAGTVDCHCGGDICACTYYGERPCPKCWGC